MSFSKTDALRQALLANTTVSTITGGQVWSVFTPNDVVTDKPWISLQRISNAEESCMDGSSQLGATRFQLTIGGFDKEVLEQLRDVIVENFVAVNFTAYPGTADAKQITIFYQDDHETYDKETKLYTDFIDLLVWS